MQVSIQQLVYLNNVIKIKSFSYKAGRRIFGVQLRRQIARFGYHGTLRLTLGTFRIDRLVGIGFGGLLFILSHAYRD